MLLSGYELQRFCAESVTKSEHYLLSACLEYYTRKELYKAIIINYYNTILGQNSIKILLSILVLIPNCSYNSNLILSATKRADIYNYTKLLTD